MALNLNNLRAFKTVASSGSFSKAAAALRVSQPAVSKAVRELEAHVGSQLLERGPKGVRLTAVGQELYAHARALFAAETAAEEEIRAFKGLRSGRLEVGASTTIATYLLPPLLGAFHRAHPLIGLKLVSGNTQTVAQLLIDREIELAFVEGPVDRPEITVQGWFEDQMVLIASPDHPFATNPEPTCLEAIIDEIFIIREPGSGSRETVLNALALHNVLPRRMLEIGSTEAIKRLVGAGLGIAIVSAAAALDQIERGELKVIQVDGLDVRRTLTRLELPSRRLSPAAHAFVDLLQDSTAPMKGGRKFSARSPGRGRGPRGRSR